VPRGPLFITGDGDGADVERRGTRICQRRRASGATSYGAVEAQSGRDEFYHRAHTIQANRLRAAWSVVGNRKRARQVVNCTRHERDTDGAARSGREARTTIVSFAKVAGGSDGFLCRESPCRCTCIRGRPTGTARQSQYILTKTG
jgi:hypothetical protein